MIATNAPVAEPARAGDRRVAGHRPLLAALAVTQTVGYGVLYYAFAVLLAPVAQELATSAAAVTGALTLSVLVAAVAAVPVGRWLDRHSGHALMTAGSVLGTAALVAWSRVHTLTQLYLVFAVIGVASAMVLYEPAFAIIVRRIEPTRRASALLLVTIVAGFASSIFLPLTGLLVAGLGWRDALLALAVLHGSVAIPLHALGLRRGGTHVTTVDPHTGTSGRRDAWTDRGFWLLVVAFTAHIAAIAVISVHLVSYLVRLGHPPAFAATMAGGLGVLSVTGRVVTTSLRRRWSTATVTAAVFGLQAAALAVLPAVGRSDLGALACVVIFGLGFGVATIARPAMLADRYGAASYPSIAGALALPVTVSKAAAPLAAALLATSAGGYTAVMAAAAGACALAASLLAIIGGQRTHVVAPAGHPDPDGHR